MNHTKLSPHEISLRTRRAINSVIDKYKLESHETRKWGLMDRIIHGYLHASEGNVRYAWPEELPDEGMQEYHVIAEVVSSRDIIKRGTAEFKNKRKWMRPYRIGAKFVHEGAENGYDTYSLDEIGGEYNFTMRGQLEKIIGHSCEDSLFQSGLKGIPTACYHTCAVRFVIPEQLNRNAEGTNIKFIGEYAPMDCILVDLYKEMEQHKLEAWQRLNLLYACSKGELKLFGFGREFKKSVEGFLKEPIAQIQPPSH